MRKRILLASSLFATICFTACGESQTPDQVVGYSPIYITDDGIGDVAFESPQPIVNGGKIYTIDSNLYQLEAGFGIHVLSIADPKQPKKIGFIRLIGVQEISIIGHYLYTNNFNDLVVIDISNLEDVKITHRIENAFQLNIDGSRPPESGYYECVDPNKGTVVGWIKKTIYSPKCRI